MGRVAVAVATYGGAEWVELAQARAVPSARDQAPTFHFHGATLAAARNSALRRLWPWFEWLVYLDADDELTPGYVDALAAGWADIRAPAVQYVQGPLERPPYVPRVAGHRHDCEAECLREGNYIVIGAMVRSALLVQAGGWREWRCYEDFDLWQRCWLNGATVESIPEAVYRAHARPDSRNRGPSMETKNAVHREIERANGIVS